LGRAFISAKTLDDFHDKLAEQALAIDEKRRLSQA